MSRFTRRNFSLGGWSVRRVARGTESNREKLADARRPTAGRGGPRPSRTSGGDGRLSLFPRPCFLGRGHLATRAAIRRRALHLDHLPFTRLTRWASDRVLYTRITDDNGRKGFPLRLAGAAA
jgi:hypothetical protein